MLRVLAKRLATSGGRFAMILTIVTGAAACDDTTETPPGGECSVSCDISSECNPGEFCEEQATGKGCCAPFTGCCNDPDLPCFCGAGEFCAEDFSCKTVAEKCLDATAGCQCYILTGVGEIPTSGTATLSLPALASTTIQVVLAETNGSPVPGATFTLELDDTTEFTVAGSNVTATATAGSATLTAVPVGLEGDVDCEATLVNLGAAGGGLRFHVFDDTTGVAITNANIVVDEGNTGAETDAEVNANNGMYTVAGVSGAYNVTVFADGYNFLSIVGLTPGDGADIALPMSSRGDDPVTGGFTGKLDFETYEKNYLAGKARSIKAGIVSGSFPLKSILNFDLGLFLGPIQDSATCESDPSAPGCYSIVISGLVDTVAPLPGGVVLSLAGTPIKPFFDVVTVPGRRYAWSLGGELEIPAIAPLITIVTGALGGGGTGDLNFGDIFNGLVPLFLNFASGVRGNLPLGPVAVSDWNDYISDPYGPDRNPAETRFPKLDSGTTYGPLSLRESLRIFTDFDAPTLPQDPDLAAGQKMEGMIVIAGVNTVGYGFVPLGLGAGLDCTEGNCLDRSGATGAGVFDGEVNGGTTCKEDCPDGVPLSVGSGRLALFHSPAHGGLEGEEWLTVVVALPLSDLASEDASIRATAFVVRDEPNKGQSNQIASASFGSAPILPDSTAGRSYDPGNSGHDVTWVTMATPEDPVSGVTTRWNIYFGAGDPGAFNAPAVPGSFDDPFAQDGNGNVNATQLGFDLNGVDLADLAAYNGTSLSNIVDKIVSFGLYSADIPAN